MEYYGYIYRVIDLVNTHNLLNPVYIGQHKGEFDANYYGSGIYIKSIVEKYGKERFKVEPIVSVSSRNEADKQEIFQIQENDCIAPKGYNLALGGTGGSGMLGKHHSSETKLKICASNRGKKRSEQTKVKLRKLRGPQSKEHIEKRAKALRGLERTEEWKAKISKALLGKPKSEEHRKNNGLSRLGITRKPYSEETKAKIGKANSVKKRSKELRARISKALTGRRLSEQTRAKLRLSQFLRRQREARIKAGA